MKYKQAKPGEWIRPIKKGYKMACCDCGLVHTMNFEHIPWGRGRKIIFMVWRNNRATASMRAAMRKWKK